MAKTTKKAMCPARICQPGLIFAPIFWLTPKIIPPIRVPHKLPRPPIITASNPNISLPGPAAGSKLVLTPRKIPAIATTLGSYRNHP